jgi:hypothetical protein
MAADIEQHLIAADALRSLINLAGSKEGRRFILEHSVIDTMMDTLDRINRSPGKYHELVRLTLMVLVNLTVEDQGQNAFLQLETKMEGLYLLKLLNFIKSRIQEEQYDDESKLSVDTLEYAPDLLTNLTHHEVGRKYILDEKRQVFPLFVDMLKSSSSRGRRLGALRLIRNCAFELDKHEYMLSSSSELLGVLLEPILVPSLIDLDEWDKFPQEIQTRCNLSSSDCVYDKELVLLLLSVLGVFVRSAETRVLLKSRCVYEVLREFDKVDEDAEVSDEIYELVHWFIL